MKFLPCWLREFLCWITGGHEYADKNLKTFYLPTTRESLMWNYCVKCGIAHLFKINTDEIVKRDLEEFHKWHGDYLKSEMTISSHFASVRKGGADNE